MNVYLPIDEEKNKAKYIVLSRLAKNNNNNITSIILQVKSGENNVYADFIPTLQM